MCGRTGALAAIARLSVALATAAAMLSGCSKAHDVSSELSSSANEFKVTRRVTVVDTRNDKVLWQMTGNLSVLQSSGDIDVICAIDGGYTKHFFRLNQDTVYIVEDLTGTDAVPYSYSLRFMPDEVEDVSIGGLS